MIKVTICMNCMFLSRAFYWSAPAPALQAPNIKVTVKFCICFWPSKPLFRRQKVKIRNSAHFDYHHNSICQKCMFFNDTTICLARKRNYFLFTQPKRPGSV